METNLNRSLAFGPLAIGVAVVGMFGLLGMLLAVVGLYGLISFDVTQRTHEIGVRMALGASRSDVLKLIVGQGMKLVLIGVSLGLGLSLALSRLLASLLFGVSPADPVALVGVVMLLTTVASLACYLPARRAMQVDPIDALRCE
jgi:putative ABC transport system permease protein